MKHGERSDVPEESHDPAEDLVQLAALERQAREGLIRAREQLLARDEGFAAVEADLRDSRSASDDTARSC
jgi:hypothetical protein